MTHRTHENSYLRLPVYYKGHNKGYRWTARPRDTFRQGLEGSSVPVESVCRPPSLCVYVHQPASSEPHILGIFMETSSGRHNQLLTPFPAPHALWRTGVPAEQKATGWRGWSFSKPQGAPEVQNSFTCQSYMVSYSTLVRFSLSLLPSGLFGFGIYLYIGMREERRNVALSSWSTVPFIHHLQCECVWFIMVTNLKYFETNRTLVEWTILGSNYSIIFSFNYFSQKGLGEHWEILKEDFPKNWVSNLLLIYFKAFFFLIFPLDHRSVAFFLSFSDFWSCGKKVWKRESQCPLSSSKKEVIFFMPEGSTAVSNDSFPMSHCCSGSN